VKAVDGSLGRDWEPFQGIGARQGGRLSGTALLSAPAVQSSVWSGGLSVAASARSRTLVRYQGAAGCASSRVCAAVALSVLLGLGGCHFDDVVPNVYLSNAGTTGVRGSRAADLSTGLACEVRFTGFTSLGRKKYAVQMKSSHPGGVVVFRPVGCPKASPPSEAYAVCTYQNYRHMCRWGVPGALVFPVAQAVSSGLFAFTWVGAEPVEVELSTPTDQYASGGDPLPAGGIGNCSNPNMNQRFPEEFSLGLEYGAFDWPGWDGRWPDRLSMAIGYLPSDVTQLGLETAEEFVELSRVVRCREIELEPTMPTTTR
jgi:hypothetical protein